MENIAKKAKISSQDLTQERLDKLKQLMPDLFGSEGKINIQSLLDLGNAYSSAKKEKYEFNWAGKLECQKLALEPTNACLLPDKDRSINFDTTHNIIIEGDNLEVLKTLYTPYFEKIKCIYIDPPYNTGNDFIYDDKRSEGKQAYWQRNGVLNDGVKLETNPESTGRKHSLWCSFIYPRLMLSRNLLARDGVIFVSIDDNEVHNLRKMMDEVFGEENFVGQLTLLCNPKGRAQDKYFATNHEYILIYSKSELPRGAFSIQKEYEQIKKEYPEEDGLGKFRALELRNTHREFGKFNRKNLYYPLYIDPNNKQVKINGFKNSIEVFPNWSDGFEGCWTWGKEKATKEIDLLLAKKVNGSWKVYVKDYANGSHKMLKTILNDKLYYTEKGQKLFNELFQVKEKIFQSPKSTDLLRVLLVMATNQDSQILDFFAGSGTTAHATLKLNAAEKLKYAKENYPKLEKGEISKEDYLQGLNEAGNRKFILTQLPEYTDEKSEAFKAGYKTISSICIERVKRAGKKIIADIQAEKDLNIAAKEQIINSLDIGFKTYQLKDTNIDKAYYEMENPAILEEYLKNSQQLKLFGDEKTNLLYEIALKNGFDLSVNFKKIAAIKDNEIYQINAGNSQSALICVDDKIKLNSINKIEKETAKDNRDWQFFCFDNALSITVKTNLKRKVRAITI